MTEYNSGLFPQFKHQAVRDLAWVMASPPLLADQSPDYAGNKVTQQWCQQQFAQHLSWLQQLDMNPGPLLEVLQRRRRPTLGHYFETLVFYWLQHLPDIELLATNLVVGQGDQQLGEFDVLFRDRQQQCVYHWEMAVKYYLQYGSHSSTVPSRQWLGPNPRDSLAAKLDKVFQRQLRLAEKPAARQLLLEQYGVQQPVSAAFIKGYLFYPVSADWASQSQQPDAIPSGIATDHLTGWWLYQEELADWLQTQPADDRWRVLSRLDWLAPWVTSTADELMNRTVLSDYLRAYFSADKRAILISQLRRQGELWCEITRGFVVHAHWPGPM